MIIASQPPKAAGSRSAFNCFQAEEYFLDQIVDLVEGYARDEQPVHHPGVPPIKISECHLVAVAGLSNELGVAACTGVNPLLVIGDTCARANGDANSAKPSAESRGNRGGPNP